MGRRYRLSAFLPADPAKITAGIEVPQLFSSLDWGTVQGYDFHGAWEGTTNHQGNLYAAAGDPSPTKFSGDLAITTYTSRGAPWLYDGTSWWSYDDPQVVAQKTAYVKSKGLGGVMVWELDGDDGTLTAAVDTGLR